MITNTTLCYIEDNGQWLFIAKKRAGDQNYGKFLGVGGHIEDGESPEECILREICEETTLVSDQIANLASRGLVTFVSDKYGTEYMHVFTATLAKSEARAQIPAQNNEGDLIWIHKDDVCSLPIWEGDKHMFAALAKHRPFSLKLEYEGDNLVSYNVIYY